MPTRIHASFFIAAVFSCLGYSTITSAAETQRPNILVILADDLGYSDIGSFGGEIDTPNLDALAKGGLRFTQFYNCARCCPSRASLLTGLYPHQTGMGHMMFDRNLPGYRGDLNRQCVTMAEVLGDAGYKTYAVGKWHLTRHDKPDSPQHNWPLQRGFNKYYGLIWGYSSFFDPAICRDNKWYSCENDPEYKPEQFYFTNALSDNAATFLQQHKQQSGDKPFFMYLAYTAAHWPMHALEKDIAKYKGRFDSGYDELRRARYDRLKNTGIIDAAWKLTPTAEDWTGVKNRDWELRCMEVYAAMIDSMDRGIGQVIDELKKQGQFDNTLILFMQDNGGCAEDRGRRRPDPGKEETFQPLRPDQLPSGTIPKQARDGRPVRTGPETMPGGPDTYISYGPGWANVSNTPFREFKHWVHEGGISTPLIAHWPNGIPASRNNELTSVPAHLIDIMPTCVDVAQTTYPSQRDGYKINPLQGISLVPVLKGEAIERAEPLFWEHEGNRAVRQGKWKLVAKENEQWELYDMEADRTELHNLSAEQPDRVRELASKWDAYAARTNVLPLGGWREAGPANNKSRVTLKQGATLAGAEAPEVGDRPLTITVEITNPKGNGVLVAQGGSAHGYALLIQDGILSFAVRRGAKLKTVSSQGAVIGAVPVTVTAVLQADGTARLTLNGSDVSRNEMVGLLQRTPKDAISAGSDFGDAVGSYPSPFKYPGTLGKVEVQSQLP